MRSEWSVSHGPAANAVATISKAAESNGTHVCNGFAFTFVAGTSAPTAVQVRVYLRDGATGAGTILWEGVMSLAAVAGTSCPAIVVDDIEIRGTLNTAMTAEFSAAGGANTFEAVSMYGYTIHS